MTKKHKTYEKTQKTEKHGPSQRPTPFNFMHRDCVFTTPYEATLTAGFRLMLSFAESSQWSAGSKPQSTNPGRHHAGSPKRLAKLLRQQESLLELGWKDFG